MSHYELCVEGHFSCAVKLTSFEEPCNRLHGHSYSVKAYFSWQHNCDMIDGVIMHRQLSQLLEQWDHLYLNEVAPFDQLEPSLENIAKTIAESMQQHLNGNANIERITVGESPYFSITYYPNHATSTHA